MDDLGLKNYLSNIIYKLGEERKQKSLLEEWKGDDANPAVHAAKVHWKKNLKDTIANIILASNGSAASYDDDEKEIDDASPVPTIQDLTFSTTTLLHTFASLQNPNITHATTFSSPHAHTNTTNHYKFLPLSLKTPSLSKLNRTFPELHPSNRHIGLDDNIKDGSSGGGTTTRFIKHRQNIGRKVIEGGYAPQARQYLKYGSPASLRGDLWRIALGLTPLHGGDNSNSAMEDDEGQNKKGGGMDNDDDDEALEALFLEGFVKEVSLGIENDETYFPFEELLRNVISRFGRDKWVAQNSFGLMPFQQQQQNNENDTRENMETTIPNDENDDISKTRRLLPSVQPFDGLIYLAAPLCLVYNTERDVLTVFKHLYSHFFSRSMAIGTLPGMLPGLLATFEDLLHSRVPDLVAHCICLLGSNAAAAVRDANGSDKCDDHNDEKGRTRTETISFPAKTALPWLCTAFARYLDVGEILLLWDRVVAYRDLNLLSVLAVSVFMFRKGQVLKCTSVRELEDVFEDGRRLKVVPLLQAFFAE
eukprot:CAMPEP_0172523484 /NCGR_PEP_ID=MMETSP1066-20121228/293687_1 /TAXON_ID=671091 /ORGANISM="Coscinodiscus wailesii, Strain CCMP2513" /LENGTH=532 /DNA_ID=CAMNT_0013306561 /DNA_START=143 /DNA_END=1741 /DNA_ORIENTATION=-